MPIFQGGFQKVEKVGKQFFFFNEKNGLYEFMLSRSVLNKSKEKEITILQCPSLQCRWKDPDKKNIIASSISSTLIWNATLFIYIFIDKS